MKLENRKILFICGAKGSYVRNKLIYDNLSSRNEVDKITSELNNYLLRIPALLIKYLIHPKKKYDCIFAGFLAQPLAIFINKTTKKPIISDMFISLYDTICYDRKKIHPKTIAGKLIYWIDKKTISLSKFIITDTKSHAEFFHETFKADEKKIKTVYLGAETKIFYPAKKDGNFPNNKFNVFYYGTVIPLQGIDIILNTAKLIKDENIHFTLVGPIEKNFKKLIAKLKLKNTTFVPWVKYTNLPKYIANSDLCLGGPFGGTAKAHRVIAGKTYQFAAMQKAIIVGDTKGNKELFTDNENCSMVKVGCPDTLAGKIIILKNNHNLREYIGRNANKTIVNLNQNLFI